MNRTHFLQQFLLPPYSKYSRENLHSPSPHEGIPSAVLIPLCEKNNELHVVLTKRAEHLRKHAGQISFPGGKVEQSDKGIVDTALRESYEEIGIAPKTVEVIGQLKNYETLTGYTITPIVGFINTTTFTLDKNEVAEVFTLPLKHFYQAQHYVDVPVLRKGKTQMVNFIAYKEYKIWGATATILKALANI